MDLPNIYGELRQKCLQTLNLSISAREELAPAYNREVLKLTTGFRAFTTSLVTKTLTLDT